MSEFEVIVKTERVSENYRVHVNSHHNKATNAAQEALRTFERHGHCRFPYEDGPLKLIVTEVQEPASHE